MCGSFVAASKCARKFSRLASMKNIIVKAASALKQQIVENFLAIFYTDMHGILHSCSLQLVKRKVHHYQIIDNNRVYLSSMFVAPRHTSLRRMALWLPSARMRYPDS